MEFILKVLFVALIASLCYVGSTIFIVEYAYQAMTKWTKDYLKVLNEEDEEL